MAQGRRPILASHLIFTGYGHWLANDPRGSGSENIRKEVFKTLGEILPGRQFPQPAKDKLREFYRKADEHLEQERVWFDESARDVIGNAVGEASEKLGYTIWALTVCANHAHAVVRTHRDRSEIIWAHFAQSAMLALRGRKMVPTNHPVWSHRIYKVFLHTPGDVIGRITYVNENPGKEGLPPQQWPFVRACPFADE